MRRSLYLITGIIILNKLYAQETFVAQINSKHDYTILIQQTKNKDFLLCDYNDTAGLVVTRFDINKKISLSKLYRYTITNGLTDTKLYTTNDDGFLLSFIYPQQNTLFYTIIRFNRIGEVMWSKIINSGEPYFNNSHFSLQICESAEGNIYSVLNESGSFFQLLKLNSKGNFLWCNRYSIKNNYGSACTNITSSDNDGIILLLSFQGCENYCSYTSIEGFDRNGNFKWGNSLDVNNSFTNRPIALNWNKGKVSVILGTFFYEYPYNTYCYWTHNLINGDSKTVLMDYNIFALSYYLKNEKLNHFQGIEIVDGSYHWIINNDWSLINTYNGYSSRINKFDTLYRVCPNYEVPLFNKKTANTFIPFYTGALKSLPQQVIIDNFKIKVSSYNLPITNICSGYAPLKASLKQNNITSSAKLSITLYPNPTTNTLTITGLNNKNKTTLQIINTNGNVLKEVTTTSSTQTINVHSLAAGAYLLRINNREKIITKTFIKQ